MQMSFAISFLWLLISWKALGGVRGRTILPYYACQINTCNQNTYNEIAVDNTFKNLYNTIRRLWACARIWQYAWSLKWLDTMARNDDFMMLKTGRNKNNRYHITPNINENSQKITMKVRKMTAIEKSGSNRKNFLQ